MLQQIETTSNDVLLDVGGNTGKITEIYARDCKEIVVLEPKWNVPDMEDGWVEIPLFFELG